MARTKTLMAMVLAAGLAAGCSSLPRVHWPWAKPVPAAPAPVDELSFAAGATAAIPQFWQGNTLVLDMTAVPASGTAVVTPTYARGWPMRISVRTYPGRFCALEVRGAQRVLLPLTTEGAGTVDMPIPPESHASGTREVTFNWGAPVAPAVVYPQAPAPLPTTGMPVPGTR